jgi:hypothetical protein
MDTQRSNDFEKAAASRASSIVGEFWGFLQANKKWWLLPIVVLLLLFGAMMLLSSTAAAPFIYTLF